MPRTGTGRYSAEDADEKKEHPRADGRQRGQQGSKEEDRWQDPQDKQAKGTRTDHMAGGNKGGQKSRGEKQPEGPTNNTTSGGNRPKGTHHSQGQVDHN
jgi:hypothetical protein